MTEADDAPVSVIILTFNEELNLRQALESVTGWAREVFVVDSYSTDGTVSIAKEFEDRTVTVVQHGFENYSSQWNWALAELPISQPWILKLDADERATPEFREEVSRLVRDSNRKEAAFVVHWRLIFMGKWLRRGGLYPNGNTRLWRAGAAKMENRPVNEHLIVEGPVGEVRAPIDHWDEKGLADWIDRHNRYSSFEAPQWKLPDFGGEVRPALFGRPDERRQFLRLVYRRFPARPFLYFLYRYVLRLGFLDGLGGFRFAFLHSSFLYWIEMKAEEHERTGRVPSVLWPPRGAPDARACSLPELRARRQALEAGRPEGELAGART